MTEAGARGDRNAAERAVSDALIDATSIARNATGLPRAGRSIPPIRNRPPDREPIRPRAGSQGEVRGGSPGLRTLTARDTSAFSPAAL
jgi:hypothetical protein